MFQLFTNKIKIDKSHTSSLKFELNFLLNSKERAATIPRLFPVVHSTVHHPQCSQKTRTLYQVPEISRNDWNETWKHSVTENNTFLFFTK